MTLMLWGIVAITASSVQIHYKKILIPIQLAIAAITASKPGIQTKLMLTATVLVMPVIGYAETAMFQVMWILMT